MLEQLVEIINMPNIEQMQNKYCAMLQNWYELINDRLPALSDDDFDTVYKEVSYIFNHLKLIQEYNDYINFASVLKTVIENK